MEKDNIRCARLTTFGDWTSYATNAMEHYADHILQPLIKNITLTTLLVQYVLLCLAPRTAITSTMDRSIATTITQPNLHSDAMDARLQF